MAAALAWNVSDVVLTDVANGCMASPLQPVVAVNPRNPQVESPLPLWEWVRVRGMVQYLESR
jgi:hypothetical protein